MIARALRAGFTSVMFDGYGLEYDEKVAQTKLVVRLAHAVGVPVETELGHVGRESLVDESGEAGELADPAIVQDFVQRTGVDLLAVAVGSTHGMAAPEAGLDLNRLRQIVQAVDCYLSLHGGSGISVSHLRSAIDLGVSKVSVFTTLARRALRQITQYLEEHESPDLPDACRQIRAGFENGVSEQIDRLGSGGKA
jgi:fructose-bisphosphate aldolase class II